MMRSEAAVAHLLALIETEPGPTAREAIFAFEIYRNEAAVVTRIRNAAAAREDLDLSAAVKDALG